MNTPDSKGNILENLKKDNPFQVPDHYFDSLGNRITNRISINSPKEKAFSFEMMKSMLGFAGGFAGLAIIIYFGISLFSTKMDGERTSLTSEMNRSMEYSIISELDDVTILENFSQDNIQNSDSILLQNDENIINYLVKENIDISTIIDEL